MPWWIWLVLVLFMLTMLVGGGAYACIRGYHAFKDAIKVGGRMSKRFEAMSEPLPQPKENTSVLHTSNLRTRPIVISTLMPKSSAAVRKSASVMPGSGRRKHSTTDSKRNHDSSSSTWQ